jgi:hypothetical protein
VCGTVLGWKYVGAEEEGQRYKVGKFILETKRVVRGSQWDPPVEEEDGGSCDRPNWGFGLGLGDRTGRAVAGEEEIEFDSQDEDECEDLFAGVWSPALAGRRRRGRAG